MTRYRLYTRGMSMFYVRQGFQLGPAIFGPALLYLRGYMRTGTIALAMSGAADLVAHNVNDTGTYIVLVAGMIFQSMYYHHAMDYELRAAGWKEIKGIKV